MVPNHFKDFELSVPTLDYYEVELPLILFRPLL